VYFLNNKILHRRKTDINNDTIYKIVFYILWLSTLVYLCDYHIGYSTLIIFISSRLNYKINQWALGF